MPATSRLSTHNQLVAIRAGLLTPQALWATVAARLLADDPGDSAAKMAKCRAASSGEQSPSTSLRMVLWKTKHGWACLARTKSEARAIYKRTCGGVVPVGTVFERVK